MRIVRITVIVVVLLLIASSARSKMEIFWQHDGAIRAVGELDEFPGIDAAREHNGAVEVAVICEDYSGENPDRHKG